MNMILPWITLFPDCDARLELVSEKELDSIVQYLDVIGDGK